MVTAQTVKGLAQRLEKAQQLVEDGAVFAVAGMSGYAVVRTGDGTQMYLVEHHAGRERCTCPDFKQRQKSAGLPCKHILAAQLALGEGAEESAAPEEADWKARGFKVDPAVGLALLRGQHVA